MNPIDATGPDARIPLHRDIIPLPQPASLRDTLRDMDPMAEALVRTLSPPVNEGNGSLSAARRYEAAVHATIAEGRVDELAAAAKRALEDESEGPELERADERARRGPVWIDER